MHGGNILTVQEKLTRGHVGHHHRIWLQILHQFIIFHQACLFIYDAPVFGVNLIGLAGNGDAHLQTVLGKFLSLERILFGDIQVDDVVLMKFVYGCKWFVFSGFIEVKIDVFQLLAVGFVNLIVYLQFGALAIYGGSFCDGYHRLLPNDGNAVTFIHRFVFHTENRGLGQVAAVSQNRL